MALLTEELTAKWSPVLDHPELASIADPYKKAVTAIVLENQQTAMDSDRQTLNETAPTNVAGGISNFDPILISLVRRALPNLIAYDVAGVQPMTGPTGLIFALRSRYNDQANTSPEAFYNEANTIFSGIIGSAGNGNGQDTANSAVNASGPLSTSYFDTGVGMSTAAGEALDANFQQMGISIEKVTVSAKTRALKAEYSLEMAQDLKAIHGLDAETELSNVLSTEILLG